ncbi:MAG TPA: zf-HC2 domain-containing protein [Nonomuraea sp.]|nr:zf-HC2 domain-containing protein [Nonomuraea sp.]
MTTCEDVRLALGAHALGALDPDEAVEIDTHLATCEVCGAELLELEGVTAFLGKVSERDVELVASPPRQVLDRLLNARAKRTRRGRLLLLAAASVAVLAVGGTVWSAIHDNRAETSAAAPLADSASAPASAQPRLAEKSEPFAAQQDAMPTPTTSGTARQRAIAGPEFSGDNKILGYHAVIMAWPVDGGTELGVLLDGVPAGTSCRLVVVAGNGRRDVTEGWVIGDNEYRDKAAFKTTTRLPTRDIVRFDVVNKAGEVLVRIDVTGK